MGKFKKQRARKVGEAPGSLIHVGERKAETVRLSWMEFDGERFEERELANIAACGALAGDKGVRWLNVTGMHDVEVVKNIGECFKLHPLSQEDVLNTQQRPKVDDYDDYLLVILKTLDHLAPDEDRLVDQISLVLGRGYVITFVEREIDAFEPLKRRIREGRGKTRKQGADYLAYSLLDAVVDHYFLVLDHFAERIETLEEQIFGDHNPAALQDIHDIKRRLALLRRAVWPLRDVLNFLIKDESGLISDEVYVFLRDLNDHVIQVVETIEAFHEEVNGLLEVSLSAASIRMNEVMKVLTMIATIFIPLSFFAGVYGMNFEHMPEIPWKYSYAVFWTVVVSAVSFMLYMFKRKEWI